MELLEGLLTRRSVRKYENKPIPKDVLEQIIKAGEFAPSAHNTQPWEFLVIQDKDVLKHFRHMQRSALFAENAAAVILVCGREDISFHREKKAGVILTLTVPPQLKIFYWPRMLWDLVPAGAEPRR